MYMQTANMPMPAVQSPVVNNNGAPAFLGQIQGGIAWALDQYRAFEEIKAIKNTPQQELTANKYTDITQTNSATTVAQPAITPEAKASNSTITVAGVTMSKPVLYAVAAVLGVLMAKKAGVI